MATNAHNILRNFLYRTESITPTYQKKGIRFHRYDFIRDKPELSSGWLRSMYVNWEGSGPDKGATLEPLRESQHIVVQTINYPAVLNWEDLLDMMLQDRHDILKNLRLKNGVKGYDSNNDTSDVGLMFRVRENDFFESEEIEDNIFKLVIRWQVEVREDE